MVLSIDIVMVWMRFIYTHRLIYLQAQSHNWWAVREGLGDVALQRMYVTNSGLWHFKSACRAQYFPLLSSCCLWIRMENSQLLLQHHACCHDNELPLWNCIQSPQLNAFLFFFFLFLTRVASAMVCLHSNRTMNKTDIFIPKKGNLSYRVPTPRQTNPDNCCEREISLSEEWSPAWLSHTTWSAPKPCTHNKSGRLHLHIAHLYKYVCDSNKQRKRGYHFESKMPLRGEVVEQECEWGWREEREGRKWFNYIWI